MLGIKRWYCEHNKKKIDQRCDFERGAFDEGWWAVLFLEDIVQDEEEDERDGAAK